MKLHKRRVAAAVWPTYSRVVDAINRNAALRSWHARYLRGPHFEDRFDLHRHIFDQLSGPLDYLEFGVFEGRSIRLWTGMSTAPGDRFFGFDTFTGLPERWELGVHSMAAGHFAVGAMPELADPRVTLIKGLFQDTVPSFLSQYVRKARVVVHCDADLYTSTLFVLTQISTFLRPGDVVIFDEFSQPLHEFRAFVDWTSAYRVNYRGLASAGDYHCQVAIEVLA